MDINTIDTELLDSLIEPILKITKEEFKIKYIYDFKFGVNPYKKYEEKEIDLLYRYYLFASYLIEKQAKTSSDYILSKKNKFNYEKNIFSVILYYVNETPEDVFNILPITLYGVHIIKKKINNDLSDINEKDIKQLIVEKLDMSIEEFENTSLRDLPIEFQEMTFYFGEDAKEKKYFKVASHFIELYLDTIKDFSIYSMGVYNEFKPEIIYDESKPDHLVSTGKIIKYIRCKLLMAPEELLNSIPKKILDIDIIIKNIVNEEVKINFAHGTFNRYRNDRLINFDAYFKIAYENMMLSLLNSNLVVSYNGNADDKHDISFTDDSIIFTVTQIHNKGECMRYLVGRHGHKIIPNKKYKYIVLRHHHEIKLNENVFVY